MLGYGYPAWMVCIACLFDSISLLAQGAGRTEGAQRHGKKWMVTSAGCSFDYDCLLGSDPVVGRGRRRVLATVP